MTAPPRSPARKGNSWSSRAPGCASCPRTCTRSISRRRSSISTCTASAWTTSTSASTTRPTKGSGACSRRMGISARRVSAALAAADEISLLDVREQGVHYRGHPFFACCAPLSRLELVIGELVPRKNVQVVVLDSGNEGLAEKAARKLKELNYSDVSILERGCEGWRSAGYELFSGVNVPSK